MPRKKKKAAKSDKVSPSSAIDVHQPKQLICFEGENLVRLLKSIQREIESARVLDSALPEKIWVKQQFSIGVNDVTRVLERMPPAAAAIDSSNVNKSDSSNKDSSIQLQAILLASDCIPQWLTKHLPSLTSSRNVPLISVKDKKRGSLRLGELVKMKTAIAVGVKARGNAINNLIEKILHDHQDMVIQTPSFQHDIDALNTGLPETSGIHMFPYEHICLEDGTF